MPPVTPTKLALYARDVKANRRRNGHAAQKALAKDKAMQGQPTPITEEEATKILAAFAGASVGDFVLGRPLDKYDLGMAAELAKMNARKAQSEALYEAGLKVWRAKNSSQARRWRQNDLEYAARMKQELGPEPFKEHAERRREEKERLAEIARLNELHKQLIKDERRKKEEEMRKREAEERQATRRRAQARHEAKEANLREQERLQAEAERQEELRLQQDEERTRQMVYIFGVYESKWEILKQPNAPTDILGQTMPWPVFNEVNVPEHITYEAVKEFVLHPLRQSVEGMSAKKKIMMELLRWHSDKFDKIALGKVHTGHQEVARVCAGLVERFLTRLLAEVQAQCA